MEFNLRIQDIFKNENVGKHYLDEEGVLHCLLKNQMGFLEFVIIEDDYAPDNDYELLSNIYNLSEILEMEFKEVVI